MTQNVAETMCVTARPDDKPAWQNGRRPPHYRNGTAVTTAHQLIASIDLADPLRPLRLPRIQEHEELSYAPVRGRLRDVNRKMVVQRLRSIEVN